MAPFGATSDEVLHRFLKRLDNVVDGISSSSCSIAASPGKAAAGSQEILGLFQQIRSEVKLVQAALLSAKHKEDALMMQFQRVTRIFYDLQQSIQSKEEDDDDDKGRVQKSGTSSSKEKKQEEIIYKLREILRDIHKTAEDADVPGSDSLAEGEEEEQDSLKWSDSVQEKNLQLSDPMDAYIGLRDELKDCLQYFVTIFPENAIVKRRLLIHLWMGAGLVSSINDGKKYFDELLSTDLIHGGAKENCREVHYCKMETSVRNVLISVAYVKSPLLLLEEDAGDEADKRKVKIVYNIGRRYLDFQADWLFDKKYLTTLQLGRWKHRDRRHHIAVMNDSFLRGLGSCQSLLYVSLRGISRVETFPNSVAKLRDKLLVLDLRACHNLEKLSPEIGNGRNLQYLDISECYLLDRMPKSVADLSELQVFKGFIVGDLSKRDICHLVDLAKLPKLRKLSINIGRPFAYEELQSLNSDFNAIATPVITWAVLKRPQQQQSYETKKPSTTTQANGGSPGDLDQDYLTRKYTTYAGIQPRKMVTMKKMPLSASLPASIEKLDLRCMPEAVFPSWINSNKLTKLKKLYVRGGELQTLGQGKWAVEVLRLRFLRYLTHPLSGLKTTFPNLRVGEVVECRNLTYWPKGLWREEERKPLMD